MVHAHTRWDRSPESGRTRVLQPRRVRIERRVGEAGFHPLMFPLGNTGTATEKPMNHRHHIARLAVSAALALVATSAFAGPHFVRGPNASLNSTNGYVTVTWKEAGLGDTVTVD